MGLSEECEPKEGPRWVFFVKNEAKDKILVIFCVSGSLFCDMGQFIYLILLVG